MPAKYAHAKKRPNAKRNERPTGNTKTKNSARTSDDNYNLKHPSPHTDRPFNSTVTKVCLLFSTPMLLCSYCDLKTIKEVSRLERAIARVLLLRYQADICRLYSSRLHNIALIVLPKLIYDTIDLTGSPGWIAANADCDEIKDFFRGAIAMDLRQVRASTRLHHKLLILTFTI